MKNDAENRLTAYKALNRGVFGRLLSRLLALSIIAVILFGNVSLAFAEEASDAASAQTPEAVSMTSEGNTSSEYALAGGDTGEAFSGADNADENTSGDTASGEDEQQIDVDPSEYALAGEGSGRDVTIHFGEDRAITIHVNPAEGEEAPSDEVPEETKAETESEAAKKEFSYEDSKVRVTATLEKPGAVPADAEFRVTEITPDSKDYNYDAYMDALNDKAKALADLSETAASQEGLTVTTGTYDESNTLLYDVAFIMQSYDEAGNVIEGAEYEYQPEEGSVNIRIEFKKGQLTDELGISNEQDVTITHLPLSDKVRDRVDTTADATDITKKDISVEPIQTDSVVLQEDGVDQADFQMDSFSTIAVTGSQQIQLEVTGYSAVTTDGILGGSIHYGVTANDWYFDNADSETSMAVGTWHGSGGQTGSNESKSEGAECQFILVGEVDSWLHLKGYKAFITSPYTREDHKISYGSDFNSNLLVFHQKDAEAIKDEVQGLIANVGAVSAELASYDSISDYSSLTGGDNATLDFTNLPDNSTYYINVEKWPALYAGFQNADQVKVKKLDGQKIVFNFPTKKDATIYKFSITNKVGNTETTYSMDSLADMTTARCDVLEDFIFNFPSATHVKTQVAFAGILLAPQARVDCYGVGGGWVICDQFYNHCEWHLTYDKIYEQGSTATLKAMKKVNFANTSVSGFKFRLEEKTGDTWTQVGTDVENIQSWVTFPTIAYDSSNCQESRDFIYRITETAEVTSIDGVSYTTDTTRYYAKVSVTKEISDNMIEYIASEPVYYTDEACSREVNTLSGLPEFNNTCETVITVNKKWFRGTEETGGPSAGITFDLYRSESTRPPRALNNGTQEDSGEETNTEGVITEFSPEIKWGNYSASNSKGNYKVHAGDKIHIVATSVSKATLTSRYDWPYQGKSSPVEGISTVSGSKTFVGDNGNESRKDVITTTFDYVVPAVEYEYTWDKQVQPVNGYCLEVIFRNEGVNDTSADVSVSVIPAAAAGGSGTAVVGMTQEQALAQGGNATWDGENHRYELNTQNGWSTTISSLPAYGENSEGQKVFYTYYVVERPGSSFDLNETTYENNEGIQSGTITIRNYLPDVTRTYMSLSVTKQWRLDNDKIITDQKSGSITFVLKQVLYHGSEEPVDRGVYMGGTLQSAEGVTFDETSGEYTITARPDGTDSSGKPIWRWSTASISQLPWQVISEDGTVLYEYKYIVKEIDKNGEVDATYIVNNGQKLGYCEECDDGSEVTIINREMEAYSLPATGGEGTRMIYLMSILLIGLAGAGLITIRRRRERTR